MSKLPYLYSDDLDRKSMWERIGNGLDSCSAKSSDWQQFVSDLFDYIKADYSKVAANKDVLVWVENMEIKSDTWKKMFLNVISKKTFFIVVKARAVYQLNKVAK